MRYLSVCSGIEAASNAWHPLGWTPVGFSEIEPFPSAVLSHHYPHVPNYGDMTQHESWPLNEGDVDLLVGGTPCQSFSVAGLRRGLSDPRGGLMLTYLEIARRLRPRWVVWENVPGVLSSNRGRDFGTLLGALGDLGYGWAYRVLDAQWVRARRYPRAVPQRRRRVFLVGCFGDPIAAGSILFESQSVRRDIAEASCEAGITDACALDHDASSHLGLWWDAGSVSQTLDAVLYKKQAMPEKNRFPAVLVPAWVRCDCCDDVICTIHATHTFECACPSIDVWSEQDVYPYGPCVLRFLTPRECERLQGFPDDWTAIPWRGRAAEDCPDGPRYRALGNSMAVNCMGWIGERIADWEKRNG